MNKRNKVKQLNRSADHRKAMIQNMVISLFRHERIESSVAKLKVARSYAERLITRAKRHGGFASAGLSEKEVAEKQLHNYRYLDSHLRDPEIIHKLLQDLASRYASRVGGYTRIIRLVNRQSDNTAMGILELVDRKMPETLIEEFQARAESKIAAKKAKKAARKTNPAEKPKKK